MKIKTEVFVHVHPSIQLNEYTVFILATTDMSSYGYAFIGKTEIEIDVDPLGVLETQIKQLDAKMEHERAESAMRLNELEAAKNNLLSIEN